MSYRNMVECDACGHQVLADRAKGWASVRIQFGPTKADNGDGEAPAPFKDWEHVDPACQALLRTVIEQAIEARRREMTPTMPAGAPAARSTDG